MGEIQRSKVGVATYLVPDGSLHDGSAVAELRAAIESSIAAGELQLVLDLSGVAVVNSEALETLLDAQDQLVKLGGELKVANANATISDVFRLTSVSAALASIDAEPRQAEPRPPPRSAEAGRIGEMLVARGLVDEERIREALEIQHQTGERMAQVLIHKGWLGERDLLEALGDQLSVPFVWLRAGLYDPAVTGLIDVEVARRLVVLPLFRVRGVLYLATAEPQSIPSLEAVEDLTLLRVKPVLACTDEILDTIAEARAEGTDLSEYMGDLESDLELVESQMLDDREVIDQMAAGSPVINLINGVIQRAVGDGASDIHIEPTRKKTRIRLRVDGVLYPIMSPPSEVHPALVSRLKVMANLDIAERRLPQDGRIQIVTRGRVVDLRFSSMPGIFGEKVVLRVLDKGQAILEIDKLGMSDENQSRFEKLLARSHGLLLVTGPTGSGKTTSLYAAISSLNRSENNIITIEDPVEYQIDGINQNQIREGIGLGFATILKHALRQDPDVILVGEIRERETAETAVHAALTGHLVLSTLHTNDSTGAVTRMLDTGVEPYLLSSALIGVMAQRLVRKVCDECKTSYAAPAKLLAEHGVKRKGQVRLTKGRGCKACFDSGYKGRIAIHEIVECDADLQRLIVSSPTKTDLEEYVNGRSIKRLLDDGIERALDGHTTLEEVFRVVNE